MGRLHRSHEGKSVVQVYDYVDQEVQMLRKMFLRRLRGYKAIGYSLLEKKSPHKDEKIRTQTPSYFTEEGIEA